MWRGKTRINQCEGENYTHDKSRVRTRARSGASVKVEPVHSRHQRECEREREC